MSESFELDPVDRMTAGAIGVPGERMFFVQARSGPLQITLAVEKEQVAVLGQALLQLLTHLPESEEGLEPAGVDLELAEPLEPQWAAGEMAIEYDEDTDRVAITVRELVREEEEPVQEPASARMVATRAQCRALAAHALDVVAQGRPRCQFCGLPISQDEQHACPSMNGHRKF